MDFLDLINSSRSLQTDYVIYFVISSCLIFQMCVGIFDVTLYTKTLLHLNNALDQKIGSVPFYKFRLSLLLEKCTCVSFNKI